MPVTIHNFAVVDDMFRWAAQQFVASMEKTLAYKSTFDVALSGGSTARSFFLVLRETLRPHPLAAVRFFLSDDRVVDMESSDSNAGNAWRDLLEPLSVDKNQLFPLFDNRQRAEICASNYQKQLVELLPKNDQATPIFDLIYLGIGEDGHTASIFPHSDEVTNPPRALVCATTPRAGFSRITFMPPIINAAREIVVMATGERKRGVIDDILHGPMKPESLPAQLILRDHDANVHLLAAV